MAKVDLNSEQTEQSPITTSLKLALISSIITTIGDARILSALIAIDEAVIAEEKEKQDKKELDDRLQSMQDQIDMLTEELAKTKKHDVTDSCEIFSSQMHKK